MRNVIEVYLVMVALAVQQPTLPCIDGADATGEENIRYRRRGEPDPVPAPTIFLSSSIEQLGCFETSEYAVILPLSW